MGGDGLELLQGTLAYQRRSELAVRIAVGSGTGRILHLALAEGFVTTAAGLGVGVGASLMLGRLIRSQLFGLASRDPLTLAGICLLPAGVSLGVARAPARRAARTNPALALRA